MVETFTIVTVTVAFFLAGAVKGVIGLGLNMVSLGLVAAALDLTTAMALLLIPSFVTNIWQSFVGGRIKDIILGMWPFLFLATITIWIGSTALISINQAYLAILLGILLISHSSLNLLGFRLVIPPRHQTWSGIIMGTANGILAGMTGSFVVPGVMYLQAIGLQRDTLVQAMGILFSLSTIGLAIALKTNRLLTSEVAAISAYAVIPAILGMVIGRRARMALSENKFRNIFFVSLFVLGLFIIIKAVHCR